MRIGSFLSVAESTGPISSCSGKKTSIAPTSVSCAIETMRGVISSFASRITSPVDGSTMSCTACAPSSWSEFRTTVSMPAFLSPSTVLRASLRPLRTRTSPASVTMSAATLRPISASLTTHSTVDSFAMIRCTR